MQKIDNKSTNDITGKSINVKVFVHYDIYHERRPWHWIIYQVIWWYNRTVYLLFESIEWCNNQYPCTQTERPKWQQYFCHGSGTVCLTPWKKCKCYCGIFVHGPVHWILTSTKISRDGVITRKNTIQDEFRQTNW